MTLSLEIDPVEALALVNDGGSLGASITLRNPHSAPILFRIQTTSPLTYRVKPSHGWVLPKSQQAITVLHVGQRGSTGSIGGGGKTDKFLIKYGAVGEEREELPDRDSPQASEAFTQMWATLTDMGECRLRVSFPGDESSPTSSKSPESSSPEPAALSYQKEVSEKVFYYIPDP